MPDIKWIKITTEMFDDEKIRIIESMPEADTLIVLWVRLICMAGKTNANGYIYLMPEIPYTIEQLAAIFARPLNTVKLAIETFSRLRMITLSGDGVIFLPAFSKHQNIEGMEKIREANRKRVAEFRSRQLLALPKPSASKKKKPIQRKTYGEFKNVFLSDEEYRKLQDKFSSSLATRIENLSVAIASKGYKYKDFYATLLNWERRSEGEKQNGKYLGNPSQKPAGAFADLEQS